MWGRYRNYRDNFTENDSGYVRLVPEISVDEGSLQTCLVRGRFFRRIPHPVIVVYNRDIRGP